MKCRLTSQVNVLNVELRVLNNSLCALLHCPFNVFSFKYNVFSYISKQNDQVHLGGFILFDQIIGYMHIINIFNNCFLKRSCVIGVKLYCIVDSEYSLVRTSDHL